jgi:hypothetical protein
MKFIFSGETRDAAAKAAADFVGFTARLEAAPFQNGC